MLTLREISLDDQEWITRALRQSDFRGCEYCFANNLAWRRWNRSRIARCQDFYLLCALDTEDGIPNFFFPAGTGDYRAVFREMQETAAAMHQPLRISGITPETAVILKENVSVPYTLTPCRDSFDYLYLSQDLISLKGKKYHKKRNHLRQFQNQYDWTFSEMTPDDFEACIAFSAQFYNDKNGYKDASSVAEQFAIHTYFTYFQELGLCGGVLRVNGELAAFSLGEPLCSDTFDIHIEKADTRFQGAYAAINHEFAAHFAADYRYINREEDLGLEGLRQSKLSYHPAMLLEKSTALFSL